MLKYALFSLFFSWSLHGYQQELLKPSDIQQIMTQILDQHLGDKAMTKELLKSSVKAYIHQFDPDRSYLLQSEVAPFLFPSEQMLSQFLASYKQGDYQFFTSLNQTVRKSILRSRRLRKIMETDHFHQLFENFPHSTHFYQYAKNEEELKKRIQEHIKAYIAIQTKRYGNKLDVKRKAFILQKYEENTMDKENEYLYQNDQGQTLPKLEQENLATLHILKALTSSLDSHTSFYEKKEAYEMRMHLQKEFRGLGLGFEEKPEGITVTKILPGSPAAKSERIQVGDLLLSINSHSTNQLSFEQVVALLQNEKIDSFKLEFKRKQSENSSKVYTLTLQPAIIVLNDDRVDVSEEKFGDGTIGIIRLHSFYQGTDVSSEKDVKDAIYQLEKKGNLKGLILDLRDNRGGFLTQAIKVAGLFITNGVIVISKYANGEERYYRDLDGKVFYDGPLVVLTSKITASAAEIVAQALQDYGVALVVGDEHTYGKGTIQTQTVTDNQSSSYFKVTVGKYYTVSGKTPQKNGVQVDIVAPSRWQHIEVGEKYANTVEADAIIDSFNDPLKDIKSELRPWFLKYYIPKLQHRTSFWREQLPTLKKNSQYRIANNKNYQYYIKGGQDITEDSDDLDWSAKKSNINGGEDDLQLKEAVDIIKDMSILYAAPKSEK